FSIKKIDLNIDFENLIERLSSVFTGLAFLVF
ncbi:hypothetical protein HAINFHK1212_1733, partial [Haemophilus influenzae HK1212]